MSSTISNNLTEYVQAVMELEWHQYTLESIHKQLNDEIHSDSPCSANQPIEPSKPVLKQKKKLFFCVWFYGWSVIM